MRIRLPHGEIVDSLRVNDVPRIYVANSCNIDEAAPANPDREDNPLDGGEADVEGDLKKAPVSRRKRKRRGSTTTAPVVETAAPV